MRQVTPSSQPLERTGTVAVQLALDQVDQPAAFACLEVLPQTAFEVDTERATIAVPPVRASREAPVRLTEQLERDRLGNGTEVDVGHGHSSAKEATLPCYTPKPEVRKDDNRDTMNRFMTKPSSGSD